MSRLMAEPLVSTRAMVWGWQSSATKNFFLLPFLSPLHLLIVPHRGGGIADGKQKHPKRTYAILSKGCRGEESAARNREDGRHDHGPLSRRAPSPTPLWFEQFANSAPPYETTQKNAVYARLKVVCGWSTDVRLGLSVIFHRYQVRDTRCSRSRHARTPSRPVSVRIGNERPQIGGKVRPCRVSVLTWT